MINIARSLSGIIFFLLFPGNIVAQNKTIDSLLLILKDANEDSNKVKSLNNLATQYININDLLKAKINADASVKLAGQLNFKPGKAMGHVLTGQIENTNGKSENAIEHYQSALTIYKESNNMTGAANALAGISRAYSLLGNFIEALKHHKSALKFYEEIGDKEGIMNSYVGIGAVHGNQANYTEALKNFLTALKMARETNNKNVMAGTLKNLSILYQYEKNLDSSLSCALESLRLYEETGNRRGIASTRESLAIIYEKQGKHEDAINELSQALKIYEEIGGKRNIAEMHKQIGVVLVSQGKYDEALNRYRFVLSIREELKDKWGTGEGYNYIGSLFAKQAALLSAQDAKVKYDSAIFYINNGVALMKEIGYKQSEQHGYGRLSEIYTAINDYKKALTYKEMQIKLRDSLMNNETTRKLEKQRTDFEVEKAVNEEKAQQEKLLAEQKFKSEKELADKNARHQIELAEEKAQKEKAIEIEKIKYEFTLAEERTEQEKILAEQKFENEKRLAQENASHQQVIIEQKALQQKKEADADALLEKEKAVRERKNELMLIGFGAFLLVSTFAALLIRQRNLKRRAIERAEAGHKMAELELQSLRAQLNPHFMFNSLNAIQDLIVNENNEKSHLYLSRFSKLLRMLLDNANQPFVTVKQELELLELYLSLENLRIPNLQYSIEKDPKLNSEDRMIPNMMLQPYIENAIWHGLSNKKGERKLQIRIYENGTATEFEVEDNGIGRKRSAELKQQFRHGHHSRGMQLLSKRFELLSKEYGTSIQTKITDLEINGNAEGTLIKIEVPFIISEQAKQLVNDTNHHN